MNRGPSSGRSLQGVVEEIRVVRITYVFFFFLPIFNLLNVAFMLNSHLAIKLERKRGKNCSFLPVSLSDYWRLSNSALLQQCVYSRLGCQQEIKVGNSLSLFSHRVRFLSNRVKQTTATRGNLESDFAIVPKLKWVFQTDRETEHWSFFHPASLTVRPKQVKPEKETSSSKTRPWVKNSQAKVWRRNQSGYCVPRRSDVPSC